ncbi:MAG: antitoxin [Clostridiales bacterium]|nr:antitoxin [Clostridiales bacterium]
MTASKAKIQANARYNAKAYDVLQARIPKSELINDRIALAVKAGKAKSKAEYILLAIKEQLRKDGLGE